jgi:hypothetical protein
MTFFDRICCQDATPGVAPLSGSTAFFGLSFYIISAFRELAAFTEKHREVCSKMLSPGFTLTYHAVVCYIFIKHLISGLRAERT